jgi:hypothetical protein
MAMDNFQKLNLRFANKIVKSYDNVKTINEKNSLFLVKNQSVSDDMWQQNKNLTFINKIVKGEISN